jgi:peptidoglycan-associated lipoprotein
MRMTILGTLTAASAALLLAACTTTPEQGSPASEAQQPGTTAGAQAQSSQRSAAGSAELAAKSIPPQRAVYFDYDKFEIKPDYRGVVEAHAKYLHDHPGAKVLIQGNADERGSREYNVGLGQRRSDNLRKTLLLLGAKDNQIEAVSLGEEKPVCTQQAEDCWWKNRRDDIRYPGEY